jgi:hypothetical protein
MDLSQIITIVPLAEQALPGALDSAASAVFSARWPVDCY